MFKWLKAKFLKFKAWLLGILVALGLVVAAAAQVAFTYTPPTTYEDGSALPLAEIQETRLYCDGVLVDTELGSDGTFSVALSVGTHVCYGTVVATNGLESLPSNEVTKVVLSAFAPSPPTLDL